MWKETILRTNCHIKHEDKNRWIEEHQCHVFYGLDGLIGVWVIKISRHDIDDKLPFCIYCGKVTGALGGGWMGVITILLLKPLKTFSSFISLCMVDILLCKVPLLPELSLSIRAETIVLLYVYSLHPPTSFVFADCLLLVIASASRVFLN